MKTIKGNIFDGQWDGLVHCCNIYNTMGAGIAKQIRRLHPKAYEADQQTISGNPLKLGYFSRSKTKVEIFNLYAQVGVGNTGHPIDRNIRYDLLYDGMFRICEYISDNHKGEKYTLVMPMLGAGLAGGDWNIIEKILESVESHFADITFNTYKL